MLNTCKSTEKPPKPKIKAQIIILIFILKKLLKHIYEIPFVTSIKPVNNDIVKESEIPKILKKFENKIKTLLLLSIEIIIENKTTKPPIVKIVFIADNILLDKISPKLLNDRELLSIEYSEVLECLCLDLPHHLNKKPTVKQLRICVINKTKPIYGLENIPTPTVPIIKSGPELLVKAINLSASVAVHSFCSFKLATIFAPTG